VDKNTSNYPPFPLTKNAVPLSSVEFEKQLKHLQYLLETHWIFTSKCVRRIFTELIGLRGEEELYPDRVVFGWDSVGDIVALYVFAKEAAVLGIHVHVVYYRTIYNDDALLALQFLQPLTKLGIKLDIVDSLEYTNEARQQALQVFVSTHPTFSITNFSDAYDIRQDINRAQQIADKNAPSYDPNIDLDLRINGLEVPGLTIAGLASPLFIENHPVMQKRGNLCIGLLSSYEFIRITAEDGTDLKLKILNRRWINEANINFRLRASDYDQDPDLYISNPPVCDNPPGEIYTGIVDAEGSFVLYQIDTDIVDFAYRHTELFGEEVKKIPRLHLTYDLSEPIKMEIKNGKIIPDSIQGNGIRAQIFKEYLKAVMEEDAVAISVGDKRINDAALHITELGLGINSRAHNPEELVHNEQVFSVVVTEKCLGVWHVAFGTFPIPDPAYDIRSISHIDNGLRNEGLRVFGIRADGKEELLTGSQDQQKTILESFLGERPVYQTNSVKRLGTLLRGNFMGN
jgi:hypothetical protein